MRVFATIFLSLTIAFVPIAAASRSFAVVIGSRSITFDKFYRTELYFGRSIKGGGVVGDEEWKRFLVDEVTPRFPDGFTVMEGYGQYRDKSGKITSEPSTVIIILYPSSSKRTSRIKIDEIRAAYVTKFDQESVLRVDLNKPVNVSF